MGPSLWFVGAGVPPTWLVGAPERNIKEEKEGGEGGEGCEHKGCMTVVYVGSKKMMNTNISSSFMLHENRQSQLGGQKT